MVAAVDQDAGTGLAKQAGHHAPDTVGRAGDECGLYQSVTSSKASAVCPAGIWRGMGGAAT